MASSATIPTECGLQASYEGLRCIKISSSIPCMVRMNTASQQSRMRVLAEAVAAPARPPATLLPKRSKVEIIKENSNYLRFPLKDELESEAPNINESAVQLIKFHGSYQQTDRDVRTGKAYQFMLRTKQPAGVVSNQLYKVMDDLADQFGSGTLRLTTRQTFQLHGVLKQNLKTVLSTIIKNMGSTLGACGDVNRNVLAPAAPYKNRKDYRYAVDAADKLAALLAPQAGSYYDIWVDGEKVMSAEPPEVTEARNDNSNGTNFEGSPEPIYGTQFLPRKFKIAVTVPTDNSVDLLTNDIGIVTMVDESGELQGYNLYVGGGMGRSHRIDSTFPRVAEPLGYVGKDDLLYAVKAIVATQRDYGRRDDRRQSRMKYLIQDWGIDKFRSVVETYYGKEFETFQTLPPWEFKSYLGWHEQGDGKLFYGVHVDNGRIKGDAKKALREVIEAYQLNVHLTPNQNLILCDIRPAWKSRITKTLAQVGLLAPRLIDNLNLTSMACPALPLCPLAIAEAERGVPAILKRIRAMFDTVGLKEMDTLVLRVTGCPNGCARPYMAELGLVGDGANSYQIWLGGTPNQTRLAQTFMEKVKIQDFEKVLEPLFCLWKLRRKSGESFGDFSMRMGFPLLKSYIESYKGPRGGRARVLLDSDVSAALEKHADEKGISIHKLATQVLLEYLERGEDGDSE